MFGCSSHNSEFIMGAMIRKLHLPYAAVLPPTKAIFSQPTGVASSVARGEQGCKLEEW